MRKISYVIKKFHKHWNPSDILKDLEELNPYYYPEPIQGIPSKTEGVKSDLVLIKDGFLTKAELISIHGKSGNILHARNPYNNRQFDYQEYESQIPLIMAKITCLLNCHQIRLLDQDFFYLINMKEEGDDHVHYYKFQEAKGQPSAPGNREQAPGS